ncbi:MAG: hypothetical protein WCK49_09425, partial [Myxococcaceae bacterium]
MFRKSATRLVLICLLLSASTPASAHYRGGADETCCLLAIVSAALCCLIARAPAGVSISERSGLGLGLLTTYMVADMGLNIATVVMDSKAKKDTSDSEKSTDYNFNAATALSGLSAGLLLAATIGGLPE